MNPAAIGPYTINRPLATGGMAELFVGERRGPHGFRKEVALKRILPQYVSDPDFKSMFIAEAKLAARFSHPSVVQVFDFGEHEGELFLAMELVEGTHVGRLLRAARGQSTSIPAEVALHIARETAEALAYAHRIGGDGGGSFVHRDVSPANILITHSGHIKLTDFGIAKAAGQSCHTEDGHVRGKLGYMSPEQVMGKRLDGRSDVFALATVMAEMLIGQPLFGSDSELDVLVRIRDADLSRLHECKRRIPQDVRALLEHGLARLPKDRPSAASFANACAEVRRRRAMAHGAERTARLLANLHLTDVDEDVTAETTQLVDTSGLGAHAVRQLKEIDSTSQRVYRVRHPDGREEGPMSFPRLVQLITTGVVSSNTQISKADQDFMAASAWPELTRFVTSPAISWRPGETDNASRQGEIGPGSLVDTIHNIFRRRDTGVLHLWDAGRRKKVYFIEGRPEFIASTDKHELLGEYLVEGGFCLRMEVEMGLALMPRYGGRLGDALVGMKVLRPVELFRAISDQVHARLLEAFRWTQGQWAFIDGARSGEETFPIGETGYPVFRDAVLSMRMEEIEANLQEDWEAVLRPSTVLEERAHVFDLPSAWLRVLRRADHATIGALIAEVSSGHREAIEDAYRALFLGLRCGLIELAP